MYENYIDQQPYPNDYYEPFEQEQTFKDKYCTNLGVSKDENGKYPFSKILKSFFVPANKEYKTSVGYIYCAIISHILSYCAILGALCVFSSSYEMFENTTHNIIFMTIGIISIILFAVMSTITIVLFVVSLCKKKWAHPLTLLAINIVIQVFGSTFTGLLSGIYGVISGMGI